MWTRAVETMLVEGLRVTRWSGSGPAVLALPGLGSSAAAWRPLADSLPDADLVSIDLRGRGASLALPGPTGLRAHARDAAAVLRALELTRVTVVGHSMGAYLAPLVLQEEPLRVRKLVLIDGGIRPAFPFFMGPALTRLVFRRQLRALDREWPSVEAMAAKGKMDRILASRPDLRPAVLAMLAAEMGGPPGALRPRRDVERCVEDAVDTFWGADVVGALEAAEVPIELLLAEHSKRDGSRPFLADKVVAPWVQRKPNLAVRRLPGNHVTVAFAPEVAAAVTA